MLKDRERVSSASFNRSCTSDRFVASATRMRRMIKRSLATATLSIRTKQEQEETLHVFLRPPPLENHLIRPARGPLPVLRSPHRPGQQRQPEDAAGEPGGQGGQIVHGVGDE